MVHKLLPGISGDFRDWQGKSRVAAVKLLSALVLLSELKLQQHATAIIKLLAVALTDTELAVVNEVFICLIGLLAS